MPDILSPAPAIVAQAWHGRDLSIAAAPACLVVHLEGLYSAVGGAPPPRRCSPLGNGTVLSTGPETCLWLGSGALPGELRQAFKAAIDVSCTWTAITVDGANATAVLRKGCAVDLHSRHFAEGDCAVTGMASMRVVLWKPGPLPSYGLLVSRSYAASFWDWLIDAAGEF